MKVSKWGNSLAIRLTSDVVKQLKVAEGDELDFRSTEDREGFVVRKRGGHEEIRMRVREMRGLRPAGMKIDRADLNEG